MTDLYEIETERLLLRQWREGDWVGLRRTYGDAEVMEWIGSMASDLASTAASVGRMSMHWRLLGYGMFAVEDRSSAEIVGRVGLLLHPDLAARGTKGRGRLDAAALGLGTQTRPDNTRSRGVMERCGLTLRGEVDFHGWQQVYYAIDEYEWPPSAVPMPSMKIRQVNER